MKTDANLSHLDDESLICQMGEGSHAAFAPVYKELL
jgi:hypothetical protein